MGLNGVDVASYQSGLQPKKMSTTEFVIVKMTQGTWYVNPYADQQYSGAKEAGKLLGGYHYGEGGDPVKEARFFVDKLGDRVGECTLGLDWEGMQNPTFGTGKDVDWCLKFMDEVFRLTGVKPVLYMSKSVCRRFDWSKVAAKYQLWCAQYGSNKATDYQSNPWTDSSSFGAWNGDTIRQYSSKGDIKGYSGYIDINKAYLTPEDWKALAAGEAVKEPAKQEEKKPEEPAETKWSEYVYKTTNPVKISNSGSDEHGNYRNGKAGDQTGKEWYIRDWYGYSSGWKCVLRHPNKEVRLCLATLAAKAAQNDHIGYDQNQRNTYGEALKEVGWDPSKIKKDVESDCSKGVIDNIVATGHIIGIDGLQKFGATYTGNMRQEARNRGFQVLTESKYLTCGDYLLAGDILLNDQHHTCTVITNGIKSGEVTPLTEKGDWELMPLLKRGDRGKAVMILQVLLGFKGDDLDGSFGPVTGSAVRAFQKKKGLEVDEEVGPLTWNALIGTL